MSGNYADDAYAAEAVKIAKGVIEGLVCLDDGCRRLWKPLYKNFVNNDPSFLVISEVNAKVAEYPTQKDRHLWDQNVVKAKDAELAAWLPLVQDRIFAACHEIIRRFGDAA